jgi:hypothetical protein
MAGIKSAGERSIHHPLDLRRAETPSPFFGARAFPPRLAHYYGSPSLPAGGFLFGSACSLTVRPLEDTGGILVILFDAHGREVTMTGPTAAIQQTAVALGAVPGELTFLPAPIKVGSPER